MVTRTTIAIDESLLNEAKELSGYKRTSDVIAAALKDMVERESLFRIAALGGTIKDIQAPPRRRMA
jgi:Arc/MetJ family transcription regulator